MELYIPAPREVEKEGRGVTGPGPTGRAVTPAGGSGTDGERERVSLVLRLLSRLLVLGRS